MSRNQRAVVLALAVVVLVVGFVLARQASEEDSGGTTTNAASVQTQPAAPADGAGTETDARAEATEREEAEQAPPSEPAPPLIVVRGGEPVGGVQELAYDKGEQVDFRVRSDAADEIHVHGYDHVKALPAGKAVRVRFDASIDGRFEVELHGSGTQIAELEVQP